MGLTLFALGCDALALSVPVSNSDASTGDGAAGVDGTAGGAAGSSDAGQVARDGGDAAVEGAIDATLDQTSVADGPPEGESVEDAAEDAADGFPLDSPAPGPIVLADAQGMPFNIAVDTLYVYWGTLGTNGALMRCPLDGGCGTPAAFATGIAPYGIASDSKNVYFTDQRGDILTCPVSGCSAAGPTPLYTPSLGAAGIAVTATSVYWAISYYGGLFACDIASSCPAMQAREIDNVPGLYIAVDPQNVYVTSQAYRQVYMVPLAGWDGGTPTTPTLTHRDGGEGSPHGIATYQGSVYWTDQAFGAVYQCRPQICGDPNNLANLPNPIATGQASPSGIAVDSTGIYWTNSSGDAGAVMKQCHGCSGAPQVLAAGQAMPYGIAMDPTAVYWTNEGDGTVMMLRK
jgi:hypothetical protein